MATNKVRGCVRNVSLLTHSWRGHRWPGISPRSNASSPRLRVPGGKYIWKCLQFIQVRGSSYLPISSPKSGLCLGTGHRHFLYLVLFSFCRNSAQRAARTPQDSHHFPISREIPPEGKDPKGETQTHTGQSAASLCAGTRMFSALGSGSSLILSSLFSFPCLCCYLHPP